MVIAGGKGRRKGHRNGCGNDHGNGRGNGHGITGTHYSQVIET